MISSVRHSIRASHTRIHTSYMVRVADGAQRRWCGTTGKCPACTSSSLHQPSARMMNAVEVLLEEIGEDTSREGLKKTPQRYAKALLDLTAGYKMDVNGMYFINHAREAPVAATRSPE